jgi:hypothetical protein
VEEAATSLDTLLLASLVDGSIDWGVLGLEMAVEVPSGSIPCSRRDSASRFGDGEEMAILDGSFCANDYLDLNDGHDRRSHRVDSQVSDHVDVDCPEYLTAYLSKRCHEMIPLGHSQALPWRMTTVISLLPMFSSTA